MNLISAEANIMIVGCGGGYDIFCGLPLYFQHHQRPILVNYSFTNTELLKLGNRVTENSSLYEIDAKKLVLPSKEEFVKKIAGGKDIPDWLLQQLKITKEEYIKNQINGTSGNGEFYFPEYELSRAIGAPVYAFHGDLGGQGILRGLRILAKIYQIDTIVTVDGGTDSLMTGKEGEMGTPHEDMLTLSVIDQLGKENPDLSTYLYVLGYNIDILHGISDRIVQDNIMELIREGSFLGCYHLLNDLESSRKYYDTFLECSPENSWINSLVCSSLAGRHGTPSWIGPYRGETGIPVSPLMGLYWIFELEQLVSKKHWDMKSLAESRSDEEVCELINEIRKR